MNLKGLKKKDINHYLGIEPISLLDHNLIWKYLISGETKKILGKPLGGKPIVSMVETVDGDFAGDEVTNLNQHRIHGDTKYIRFPYLKTTYEMENGLLIIKQDQTKLLILGWYAGDNSAYKQLIYKVAFRDRCFDGTAQANDCSLQDFPRHDPILHKPLIVPVKTCEISTYGFLPNTRLKDVHGDEEFDRFVGKPFSFIDNPKAFLKHFERAFYDGVAPGQIASPIPDMAHFMGPNVDYVLRKQGYHFAEGAASHYHVYHWGLKFGWRVTDPEKAAMLKELTAGFDRLKEKGVLLRRAQQSWVAVLQSLPKKYIPEQLYLGGATWQHDGLNKNYLWMHKPLTEKAESLRP